MYNSPRNPAASSFARFAWPRHWFPGRVEIIARMVGLKYISTRPNQVGSYIGKEALHVVGVGVCAQKLSMGFTGSHAQKNDSVAASPAKQSQVPGPGSAAASRAALLTLRQKFEAPSRTRKATHPQPPQNFESVAKQCNLIWLVHFAAKHPPPTCLQ